MQWENVYVFISSTFNDMHAERDYLVKSVFPALSEWCEERKLRLIDIDLRWGVTAADAEAKNTVRACLRNIDESRPFFLCFLGQRRGWVPSADDIGGDTYELFPNLLQKRYVGDTSVTEMEILHALVDPLHNGVLRGTKDDSRSGEAVEHAFFYLRTPEYLQRLPHGNLRAVYTNEAERDPATADRELTRWREREIPGTGRPVHYYTADWRDDETTPEIALPLCVPTTAPKESEAWDAAFAAWKKGWAAAGVAVDGSGGITGVELDKAKAYNETLTKGRLGDFRSEGRPLAEVIIEQLKAAIAARFPSHMTAGAGEQTPLQREIDRQAQFLRLASEGFIERTGDFDELYEYARNEENRPFAVTAYAGMGKTSLLAHFIETYRTGGEESLHYRFIGASDDSVDPERLVRSLLSELEEAGKLESGIPVNSADMMKDLTKLLDEVGTKGKTILVIDALNQLESGMSDLSWIPSFLPGNVKLIVSFKRGGDSAEEYYRKQEESAAMLLHSVRPFDSPEDRKALVNVYLEQYFKELDEPRIQALIESDGAGNPLFLKVTLSELRVFGVHNDLTEVIRARFGNTPKEAFLAVLERMETDPAYTKLTLAAALPNVLGWLAHSRYGMSIEELADLLVRERMTDDRAAAFDSLYLIVRQLRPFLAKRDGRIDFFYESFKLAATERYTAERPGAREAAGWHESLAEYFETRPLDDRHKLMELAWQWYGAKNDAKLFALLENGSFVQERFRQFDVSVLIKDFSYSPYLKDVANALRRGAHILWTKKEQLAEQIIGRVDVSVKEAPAPNVTYHTLHRDLRDSKRQSRRPWFVPIGCFPTDTNSFIVCFRGHNNQVNSVAFSKDGAFLASGSEAAPIGDEMSVALILWEIATGKIVRMFDLPPLTNVGRVMISPRNRYLLCEAAAMRGEGERQLWDIASAEQIPDFQDSENPEIRELLAEWEVAAAGRRLFTMTESDKIVLRPESPPEEITLHITNENDDFVLAAAANGDESFFALGFSNGRVMLYDRNASEQINFMAHEGFIRALEFHGDLLASASADATIKLWDVREIVRRHRSGRGLKADSSPITCIVSGERYIYAGSAGGTCIKWSKQFSVSDAPLPQFAYDRQDRYDAGEGIHDMDVCPDGNLLAVSDSSLLEIGADFGGSRSLPTDDSYRLVRTIDDRYAVVCGESFALYDRKKGRLKKLKGFPLRTCLDLSKDKSTAIVALEPIRGAELEVWNIKKGKVIKTLSGHFQNSGAACCLLSPDGKKAVSSGVRDRTIILWNVGRGVPVSTIDFAHEMEKFTLYSEEQSIKVVSWGDLRYVVSYALMEPVLKLWDMNTGERLAEINIDFKPTAMRAIADGIIAIGVSTGELMLFQIEMCQGDV